MRKLEPQGIVAFHQADVGEYLRDEETVSRTDGRRKFPPSYRCPQLRLTLYVFSILATSPLAVMLMRRGMPVHGKLERRV